MRIETYYNIIGRNFIKIVKMNEERKHCKLTTDKWGPTVHDN